jgi:hypothetical protein
MRHDQAQEADRPGQRDSCPGSERGEQHGRLLDALDLHAQVMLTPFVKTTERPE